MSDGDFFSNFMKLPVENKVEIVQHLDTKSKLQLALAPDLQSIFADHAAKIWAKVEVTITSGTRTLPFLANMRSFVRSLVVNVGSDTFGLEGSLPEFPILTELDLRATPPAYESLDACLTPDLRSAFPALRKLRLNGDVSGETRGLHYIFPGLTSLQMGSDVKINSGEMNDILSRFAALDAFTLEGTWTHDGNVTRARFDAALKALGGLREASVHGVNLERVNVQVLDKLAGSKLAKEVRDLRVDPCGLSLHFTPATSMHSFTAIATLKLMYNSKEYCTSMSTWLSGLRDIHTLETLFISGYCTLLPMDAPGSFWDDAECLPPRLSTICLGLSLFGGFAGTNVMRAIARRSTSLKNIVICKFSPSLVMRMMQFELTGFADLVTGVCNGASSIEYLSIEGHFESAAIGEDEVGRVCSHLMTHAHELSNLKFLYFDILRAGSYDLVFQFDDPSARYVFSTDGCSAEVLQQQLPAGEGECLIKLGGPARFQFSDAEKEFVRGLDGCVKTRAPMML